MVRWYEYGPGRYKMVSCPDHMETDSPGPDPPGPDPPGPDPPGLDPRRAEYERDRANLRRAQRAVEGLGLCNDWDFFFTGTLGPGLKDRDDYDAFRRGVGQLCRRRDVKYLIVPERHKAGGYHCHGLLSGGVLARELRRMRRHDYAPYTDVRLPYSLLAKLDRGDEMYTWSAYTGSYGYCDLEPVHDQVAVGRYMCKYMFKALGGTAQYIGAGKSLYWCSRGLNRPKVVPGPDYLRYVMVDGELVGVGDMAGMRVIEDPAGRHDTLWGSTTWYYADADSII